MKKPQNNSCFKHENGHVSGIPELFGPASNSTASSGGLLKDWK